MIFCLKVNVNFQLLSYYLIMAIFTFALISENCHAQLSSEGRNKTAYATFKNGEKKFLNGNLNSGELTFSRSASKYEENGEVDGYIAAKAMEAIVLLSKDQPKEAFKAFIRAEELYEEQNKHNEATSAYLNLCIGKYHLYYDEQKEATKFLDVVEKVVENNPDIVSPVLNIELQHTLGELHLKKGDKKAAFEFFEEIIEAGKNLPPEDQQSPSIVNAVSRLSDLYEDVLEADQAADRFRQLLERNDTSKLGTLNYKTGRSLYNFTDYDAAYSHLEEALKYDLPPEQQAETKSMLATIAMSIKDYDDALEKNGEALSTLIKIKAPSKLIYDGLLKQGHICKELEETGKSLYWYKKTVIDISDDWTLDAEFKKYGLQKIEHATSPELNENFNIALLNYERAFRLIDRLPFSERNFARVDVLMSKGTLYFLADNIDSSKVFFERAMKIIEQVYPEKSTFIAECSRYLSKIDLKFSRFNSALSKINRSINAALFEGSVEVSDFEVPGKEAINLQFELLYSVITKSAIVYQKTCKESKLTKEHLETALKICDYAKELLVNLRAAYRSEGSKYELSELSEIINHQAIEIASRSYELNKKEPELERIFNYVEHSKSSLLLQAVQQLRAQKVSGVPDWVVEKENKFKIEMAYINSEIFYEAKRGAEMDKVRLEELEAKLDDLKEKYPKYLEYIEKTYPEYYEMKYRQKSIQSKELQKRMAKDDIIIDYVVIDSFIHIVLTDKNNLVFRKVSAPPNLSEMIPKYISSLRGSNQDDFIKYSNLLYKTLYWPVSAYIRDNTNIVIIPDGVLNYIPFELIPTEQLAQSLSKGKDDYNMFKRVPYWLKKASITYNYSPLLYLQAKEHDYSNVPDGFMGFAPDFSNIESFKLSKRHQQSKYEDLLLSPLENAAIEVKMIGDLTMGSTHVGFDAKESTFKQKASDFGVLHFATHGILNNKYPLYSSLVLLGDEQEDGLLHTYELYNMKINAELVALSACNTGIGSLQKGEGAMSVARGFAYAGCPNIAMTLWPVSDQATQILMENFYTYLMQGYPKAKALQKAKLNFIEKGNGLICAPYFWSGMILVGTPDKMNSLQILSSGPDYRIIGLVSLIVLALIVFLIFRYRKKKSSADV